jgi:hypothetical protein
MPHHKCILDIFSGRIMPIIMVSSVTNRFEHVSLSIKIIYIKKELKEGDPQFYGV